MAAPFARLLANLVVMGTGVLGRAFIEAYKQALAGGGAAAAGKAGKAAMRGGIMEQEARQILNVAPKATEAEVVEAADRLHAMNDPAKGGSAYLQTKINNARAALVVPPEAPPAADAGAKPDASKPEAGKADGKADAK